MRTRGQKTGARVPRKRGVRAASAQPVDANPMDTRHNHLIPKEFRHANKRLPQGYDTMLGKTYDEGVDLSGGEYAHMYRTQAARYGN